MNPAILILSFLLLGTSRAPDTQKRIQALEQSPHCGIEARFKNALLSQSLVYWVFEPTKTQSISKGLCPEPGESVRVFIPGAKYSKLTKNFAYPVDIQELKPDAPYRFELRALPVRMGRGITTRSQWIFLDELRGPIPL